MPPAWWTPSWSPPPPARSATARSGSRRSTRSSGSAPGSAGRTRSERLTSRRPGQRGTPPRPRPTASGGCDHRGDDVLDLEALTAMSRAERVATLDSWLTGLLADAVAGTPPPKQRRGAAPPRTGTDGLALAAAGSLARREPPPHGDLDLVLVHDGPPEIAALA